MKKHYLIFLVLSLVALIFAGANRLVDPDTDSTPSKEMESQTRWNICGKYTLRESIRLERWTYGTFDIPESAERVRLTFDIIFTQGDPEYYLQILLFQDGEDLWSELDFYQNTANFTIEGINGKITFNVLLFFGKGTMTVEWFGVG